MTKSSERPLAIIGFQRTGTTVISRSLGARSDVHVLDDEVRASRYFGNHLSQWFSDRNPHNEMTLNSFNTFLPVERPKIRAFGIKANFFTNENVEGAVNALTNHFEWLTKIIVIRTDLVATLYSKAIAEQTGLWHSSETILKERKRPRIKFSRFTFLGLASNLELGQRRLRAFAGSKPNCLCVCYEEDIKSSFSKTIHKIERFVGLPNSTESNPKETKLYGEGEVGVLNLDQARSWEAAIKSSSVDELQKNVQRYFYYRRSLNCASHLKKWLFIKNTNIL